MRPAVVGVGCEVMTRRVNVEGLTDSEFDGVSAATLRYWLKWWCDPVRTPAGDEERGRDPVEEAKKVWRELDARYHAGSVRNPPEDKCWDGAA